MDSLPADKNRRVLAIDVSEAIQYRTLNRKLWV
jgi:hypothetical protein